MNVILLIAFAIVTCIAAFGIYHLWYSRDYSFLNIIQGRTAAPINDGIDKVTYAIKSLIGGAVVGGIATVMVGILM